MNYFKIKEFNDFFKESSIAEKNLIKTYLSSFLEKVFTNAGMKRTEILNGGICFLIHGDKTRVVTCSEYHLKEAELKFLLALDCLIRTKMTHKVTLEDVCEFLGVPLSNGKKVMLEAKSVGILDKGKSRYLSISNRGFRVIDFFVRTYKVKYTDYFRNLNNIIEGG